MTSGQNAVVSGQRALPAWQQALERVLLSWQGTPWMAGQCCRGRGVDCVRFVVAVLDELHHYEGDAVPRLPQDMSLHDRAGAMRVVKLIERRWPNRILAVGEAIEPGDVVVIRTSAAGGPGHVLIAGVKPAELWHATSMVGVVRTSLAVAGPGAEKVVRIWRTLGRESWR